MIYKHYYELQKYLHSKGMVKYLFGKLQLESSLIITITNMFLFQDYHHDRVNTKGPLRVKILIKTLIKLVCN